MDVAKHWKTILETLHDGLMVVDQNGKIISVNPAFERMTGYKTEESVGKSCRILNCTGCNINTKKGSKWCRLFSKGQVKAKQCTITSKDKRLIHILKSASVMNDKNGNVIGAVETLTDISESIRQQEKIQLLRKSLNLDEGYHDLLGKSPVMQEMFELIENVAQSDAPVMIQGPSGSGKELVAMAIHEAGSRRNKSFIKVNCAALNENLLESEFFGHMKGAFTGADRTRIGRFEAANGGSIFLDEIGDIPIPTQVKLLRVLEDNVIERVGDHRPIPVDVRIITATNKNLELQIQKGLFREDLFFRINVFPIACPPLAYRREDIPLLAQRFVDYGKPKNEKRIMGFTPEALEILSTYDWPGNVRELRNAIDYAMVLCSTGLIGAEHLPPKIAYPNRLTLSHKKTGPAFHQEREQMIRVLKQAGGNQTEVARILGVSRVTVWKRIKKYDIDMNSI